MRYSMSAADGRAITLDDLARFVEEMTTLRQLPGSTQVRAMGALEFDIVDGPRITRVTADTEPDGPAAAAAPPPNRATRRTHGHRPGRR